jgi:hypothetical protein
MAIQIVNGRNAYVITAEVPTARTSTGEGYGSFYSNLRWKLWEKAEESTKVAIGFEKMAYEAQLDFAMKQRADIQKRVEAYEREISRLEAGETKDNARIEGKRDDDALKVGRDTRSMEFGANKASVPSTTVRGTEAYGSSSKVSGPPSDPIFQPGTPRPIAGGTPSPAAPAPTPIPASVPASAPPAPDAFSAAAAKRAPGPPAAAPVAAPVAPVAPPAPAPVAPPVNPFDKASEAKGPYRSEQVSDRQTIGSSTTTKGRPTVPDAPTLPTRENVDYSAALTALREERDTLQKQLGEVTIPTAPSVDLLERSRAKYEQSYGVGGMFGISERRDKIQPRFDEPASLKRAQAIAASAAEEGLRKYTEEKQGLDPSAIITPEEAQNVRKQSVLDAIGKLGGREVSAENFLGKEEPIRAGRTAPTQFTPEEQFLMEAGLTPPARGEAPIAPPATAPAPVPPPGPPPERRSIFPIDRTTPEGRAFAEEARRIEAEKKAAGTFVRNPFRRTPVERAQDLLSLGITPEQVSGMSPASPIAAPGAAAAPMPVPMREPSIWDTIAAESARVPPTPIAPPAPLMRGPEMGGITVPPVDRTIEGLKKSLEEYKAKKDKTAADKKIIEDLQKQIGLDQLPSKEGSGGSSGAIERREGYKLALLEKATKLANQPKKFERLAKPSLSPEDRKSKVPEYIILVDNLYDTNERSGNEPVKASYDEINRVFSDKPEIRASAQEYLLAKDLLNSKTKNPEV